MIISEGKLVCFNNYQINKGILRKFPAKNYEDKAKEHERIIKEMTREHQKDLESMKE